MRNVTMVVITLFAMMGSASAQCDPVWVQASSAGPAARLSHAMAYDSVRQRTVLPMPSSTSACRSLLMISSAECSFLLMTLILLIQPEA
jgi:hypothetical protein